MKKVMLFLPLLAALLWGPSADAQLPLVFQLTGPAGSVPLVASTTGTTAQITAQLNGGTGQFTYICGFVVSSAGTTTATSGNVTITGIVSQMNFTYAFVSSGQGLLGVSFGPDCITSSAANTNIVVTVPAGGTGTTVAVTAWGWRL